MQTKIYQICYSLETLENIPNGFLIMDNLKNERPDWREYWAIRNFLINNSLSDDTLYGFFSPKFTQKTNLDYQKIQNFLMLRYNGEDVVSFSPFWDLMGVFKNTFEQGDFFHPGLMEVCQDFADRHLCGIDLKGAVTHSGDTIFCNYFLAKKSFWKEWLTIGEKLFHLSEGQETSLAVRLNEVTNYGEQREPMKIFVQERIATICLLANKIFKCLNYSSFDIGSSTTMFNTLRSESILSDALKRTFTETGHQVYLDQFYNIRNDIIGKLNGQPT